MRKQVVNCLGGDLDFIRETLLEGKLEVAFISKEGREPKKPPTRTTSDFPSTAYVLTKDYAFVSNPYAFNDGRNASKTVDLCMVMGMDVEIDPLLEEWRMDLSEKRIEIRKKPGQIVHACDKWMTIGVPTGVPTPIIEKQLMKAPSKRKAESKKTIWVCMNKVFMPPNNQSSLP